MYILSKDKKQPLLLLEEEKQEWQLISVTLLLQQI